MDEYLENSLKMLCCTCLSKDRKLFQLCRVPNGVNNLYLLLSLDSEAYREGFYKSSAKLFICWECKALLRRLYLFRLQACSAQKLLSHIETGRVSINTQESLSRLTVAKQTNDFTHLPLVDNFVDCGEDLHIKVETALDDMAVVGVNIDENVLSNDPKVNGDDFDAADDHFDDHNIIIDDTNEISHVDSKTNILIIDNDEPDSQNKSAAERVITEDEYIAEVVPKQRKKGKQRRGQKCVKRKIFFKTVTMNEEEMLETREKKRLKASFADAVSQCDFCIEGFKSYIDLENHNKLLHTEKLNHVQCIICQVYVHMDCIDEHFNSHHLKYECDLCEHFAYTVGDMSRHLRTCHKLKALALAVDKPRRKTPFVKNPGSKPRRNKPMKDKRTPYGFKCPDCDKYFENKNLRYKHIQRQHREGYECCTCGKRYPFKDYLAKHVRLHQGPIPREECNVCHKMIRADLVRAHSLIHSERETFACVECDKGFACRASYEHHLKYSQPHANVDVLKYKCTLCDKGYRSKGELRDHYNYRHLGKTQHKCPICGKALANQRCITRHIKRAHQDIKEGPRDKICQQCGKAFRDKKGLREHEFIHTGERPLSCEICGCTFRQSASLYTHKKRVHKICPERKKIELIEPAR